MRKRSKYHIICSWLMLFCFAAGQIVVYAHQHPSDRLSSKTAEHSSSKQAVTDKCQLCDAMHFNHMDLVNQADVTPAQRYSQLFVDNVYNFVSISVILAAGRSPPVS